MLCDPRRRLFCRTHKLSGDSIKELARLGRVSLLGTGAVRRPKSSTRQPRENFCYKPVSALMQRLPMVAALPLVLSLIVANAQKPAINRARLWRDQGKPQQAHELLAPVYHWFTEMSDTRDLKEAKAHKRHAPVQIARTSCTLFSIASEVGGPLVQLVGGGTTHARAYSHPRSPNAERSTPGGAYHPPER